MLDNPGEDSQGGVLGRTLTKYTVVAFPPAAVAASCELNARQHDPSFYQIRGLPRVQSLHVQFFHRNLQSHISRSLTQEETESVF